MNCSSARSSRASAPLSTTKRAPDSFAAASKSISPSASPMSKCSFGLKPSGNFGGAPWRRTSTLSFSSLPTGTSASGRLGMAASSLSSAAPASRSAASSSGIVALRPATSARRSFAAAASFLAIAAPISFEAALRRSCAFCSSRIAARRVSSSAISELARGASPRRASPSSKALGFSRIALMSCMISPDGIQPAQAQPVAENIDAEACHYQNRAPKLKRVQRLAEDDDADDRRKRAHWMQQDGAAQVLLACSAAFSAALRRFSTNLTAITEPS